MISSLRASMMKPAKWSCTLEEEDDTDAFVIFLSEEGRWLVYMDPEYREVIMVRQIVSLLDNELLYISRDHKTAGTL